MLKNTVAEVMIVRLNVSFTALLIMSCLVSPFHVSTVFTDTVKYDHRIIHGKTNYGKNRSDKMLVNFKGKGTMFLKKRKILQGPQIHHEAML